MQYTRSPLGSYVLTILTREIYIYRARGVSPLAALPGHLRYDVSETCFSWPSAAADDGILTNSEQLLSIETTTLSIAVASQVAKSMW